MYTILVLLYCIFLQAFMFKMKTSNRIQTGQRFMNGTTLVLCVKKGGQFALIQCQRASMYKTLLNKSLIHGMVSGQNVMHVCYFIYLYIHFVQN